MGFRLYVNDNGDLCCGKLFSYVTEHLESLQYLLDIGVLDDYISDIDYGTPYEKAELVFDIYNCVDIELTYQQFRTFMLLYMCERYAYYLTCIITIKETVADYTDIIKRTPVTDTIKLCWR